MLNILDIIFLFLAFAVTFTGVLIQKFEKHLPAFIIKGYKYGCFAYEGTGANFLQIIEMPKAYYRHFYIFSSIFSVLTSIYMFEVYYMERSMNSYVPLILKVFMEEDRPSVSASAAIMASCLLALQCCRRLYETCCIQVFAKTSKMNLSHYLAGMIHYFGCIVACIGQAPLFCGSQNRSTVEWNTKYSTFITAPCILLFMWAWHMQYETNQIFANLRKDKKSGKVVTEDHLVPNGGLFNFVSSPHRLCEIIMYTTLLALIPTRTFFCIYIWVFGNQVQTAIQAHEWYKKTFKNYPANRFAIFPGFL